MHVGETNDMSEVDHMYNEAASVFSPQSSPTEVFLPEGTSMIAKLDEEHLDHQTRIELFYINHEGMREAWRIVVHAPPRRDLKGMIRTRHRSAVETSPAMAHVCWHEATCREPRVLRPPLAGAS